MRLFSVFVRIHLKQTFKTVSEQIRNTLLLNKQVCFYPLRPFSNKKGMDLGEVVNRLQKYACPSLAASWDNVGLLVEPSSPHTVSNLLLTNDLTQEVVEEALKIRADLIISYHPPIFKPLNRLTQKTWKERVIVRCLENRIAIYSPHTSYDVICHGINDWLTAPFEGNSEPIITSSDTPAVGDYSVAVNFPDGIPDGIEAKLVETIQGVAISGYTNVGTEGAVRLNLTCAKKSLQHIVSLLENSKLNSFEIVELVKPPLPGCGYGRLTMLSQPITVQDAVRLIKTHLKMNYVRLALGSGKTTGSLIQSVAVCAGSGSSVLHGVKADLYLTGEMSHHEVLDAVQSGTSVVLCDHSNTERGFLTILQQTLDVLFEHKVNIQISVNDKDPLEIV